MLAAAGAEVSVARLAGIFGHAFSFYTKQEPGDVWQSTNIDWWLLWDSLDLIDCVFEEVQANCNKIEPEQLAISGSRRGSRSRRASIAACPPWPGPR